MDLKLTITYLKSVGYTITENTEARITCFNLDTKYIITQLSNGYTIISQENTIDIRFKGVIENLQELKGVIKLIIRIKKLR